MKRWIRANSDIDPDNNINISVHERWGHEEITSFDDEDVERAVETMKKAVVEALKAADNDVDRAYEYLADAFPYSLYDDEGTKIVDNRDDHNIIGVEVMMNEFDGKIDVELVPVVFDESDFLTREELDAVGLYERRR